MTQTDTCENGHGFLPRWVAKFAALSNLRLQKHIDFLALKFDSPGDRFEERPWENLSDEGNE